MQSSWVGLGISALFLGAAGAAGAFGRRASRGADSAWLWLPAGYAAVLALGGAAVLLSAPAWPLPARLLLVGAGIAVALSAARRPGWLPASVLRRAFGHGYLAGVMALAALWGLSQAFAGPAPAPLLIALSAVGAGAASSGTALGKR